MPAIFRAFRHRNYQLFFVGQFVSLTGTWMQTVAQSWLVYRLTGSSFLLGSASFVSQIPVFVLAPLAGTIADRYPRHRIVVAAQTAAMVLAFCLAALTLTGRVAVWHVFVLGALGGVVNAFDIPARQAFMVEMVGKHDLMNAIALNSSMVNATRVVGPALAGIVVAAIGEGWCFLANAVSYVAVVVGLLLMRTERRVRSQPTVSAVAHVAEGFRFIRRTAPIRALLLLLGLVSLMGMPFTVLMPIFADRILHGGPRGLGWLMGASGLGAMLGALTLAARQKTRGLGQWVAYSAAAFGVSLILFAASPSFWVSAVILGPVGFSMMVEMAASNTLLQAMVPDEFRGRVMAAYSMMFMGMAPFGALLAGALADSLGAPRTVALGGVACIAGSAIFARGLPTLRGQARQLILAQQVTGGEPAEQATASAIPLETE